jgi:class 3 adenylate cyclase
MACGTALEPSKPAREVRKTVTVLFCDVTGSTALGERLEAEALRDVMSRYFETMRAAVERHGGVVEKFIGDAVLAVFGIPHAHEDDALRAARAAVEMRTALAELNKELERDRGAALEVRMGINTGEVVAGDEGPGQSLVLGDPVNVGARLEQHAAPGQILLGDTTYRLIRDAVEAEAVEPLSVKGKSAPIAAWRLLLVPEGTSGVPRRLDAPMVGRARQLRRLREAFEAAVQDRACHLFTILGPPGVGKSRLVEEFVSGVEGSAEILRGRCLPYGDGITYFPVVETIKQAAGLGDFSLPDVVEPSVCAVLEGDEYRDAVCGHIAQLLGIGDETAGEETFWAIRRFFEAIARDRPLVLVFDEIHWGEPTFLDLVEHIADWARDVPILLLCMARGDLLEVRPRWGGGTLNATTVSLEPLSGDEATTLIENLARGVSLPAGLAARIVEASEGNPLFVEQMVEMLIDEGVLGPERTGAAEPGRLDRIAIPPSMQALLQARLHPQSPALWAAIDRGLSP